MLLVAGLALLALIMAGCPSTGSSGSKQNTSGNGEDKQTSVKIGVAGPFSGVNEAVGQEVVNAVKLAIKQVNDGRMSIKGKTAVLEVVHKDDRSDARLGKAVAEELIDQGVVAVIGHVDSGPSLTGSDVYKEKDIPQISPTATNPELSRLRLTNFFRVVADDRQQAQVAGDFAADVLGATRVVVLDEGGAYGKTLAHHMTTQLKERGASIVLHESMTAGVADYSQFIERAKALSPDLFYFAGLHAQGAVVITQLRAAGLNVPFLGADGVWHPDFVKLAGGAAEGAYASRSGEDKTRMPGWADFEFQYKEEYPGVALGIIGPYAYDATRILLEAIQRCDCASPKEISKELHGIRTFEGVTGRISFTDTGDLKNGQVSLYKVQGDTWVLFGG